MTTNQKIYKSYAANSKAVDEKQGIYQAWASTESADRVGDIVRASGIDLTNFLKNPVIPWAHSYEIPPVAKAIDVVKKPGIGLQMTFQFAPDGTSALGDTIHKLWAAGFLGAMSIGFLALQSNPINPGDKYGPQEYTKIELLETSIVMIPANPSALALGLKNMKNHSMTDKELQVFVDGLEKWVDLMLKQNNRSKLLSERDPELFLKKFIEIENREGSIAAMGWALRNSGGEITDPRPVISEGRL